MQETLVWSLGQKDPWEQEMAMRSSIHAWRIPWTEELGGLQSTELQRIRHDRETDHIKSPILVTELKAEYEIIELLG